MTIGRNGTHRERLLYVFVSFCFVMYVYGRYVKIMLPLLDFDGNGALGNKFPPHTSQHPKKWWFFIVVYGVPALRACFWRIFRNFLRENLSECQVAKSKFGPRRSLEVAQAPPIRSNQTHISYRRASVEHRAFASVLGLWGFSFDSQRLLRPELLLFLLLFRSNTCKRALDALIHRRDLNHTTQYMM